MLQREEVVVSPCNNFKGLLLRVVTPLSLNRRKSVGVEVALLFSKGDEEVSLKANRKPVRKVRELSGWRSRRGLYVNNIQGELTAGTANKRCPHKVVRCSPSSDGLRASVLPRS